MAYGVGCYSSSEADATRASRARLANGNGDGASGVGEDGNTRLGDHLTARDGADDGACGVGDNGTLAGGNDTRNRDAGSRASGAAGAGRAHAWALCDNQIFLYRTIRQRSDKDRLN